VTGRPLITRPLIAASSPPEPRTRRRAKRLRVTFESRYVYFQSTRRRLRTLFLETASEIERGKNPQRSRDWVEASLETLRRDEIIAAWSYVQDVDLLPGYKWLEPWLEYHIAVILKR